MPEKTQIVSDGRQRGSDACIEQVRAEVEATYAEQLKTAGIWKRLRLRRKMAKEIGERIARVAPRDGLY